MLKVIDKVLPSLVVRGPSVAGNVLPMMSIFHEAVVDGLKCLSNGCDACTAVCYVAKHLSSPENVESMFSPQESAPNLDDFENPLNAFAAIAMDSKGSIFTMQVPQFRQGIIKAGLYSAKEGGLSIAANPEVAECLVNSIKSQISPIRMLKQFFCEEERCKGPLGGICMDACGSIGAASINGVMPWAAGKANGDFWSGYESGRFSILNSNSL